MATITNLTSQGVGSVPPNGSAFAISASQYAVDVDGGCTIDRLSVTGNLDVSGKVSAKNLDVSGALCAAQVSCLDGSGKGLSVSDGVVDCFNCSSQTIVIPVGEWAHWDVSDAFETDAIVTGVIVPTDGGDKPVPVFDQMFISSPDAFDRFLILCSGKNFGGQPPGSSTPLKCLDGAEISAFGRSDIRTWSGSKPAKVSATSVTIPVQKGECVFYCFCIDQGAPDNVGLYLNKAMLGGGGGGALSSDEKGWGTKGLDERPQ